MGRGVLKQGHPEGRHRETTDVCLRGGMQKAGMVVLDEAQAPEYAAVDWKYSGRALVIHRLTEKKVAGETLSEEDLTRMH